MCPGAWVGNMKLHHQGNESSGDAAGCCFARLALPVVVLQGYGGAARCVGAARCEDRACGVGPFPSGVPLTCVSTSRFRASSICLVWRFSVLMLPLFSGAVRQIERGAKNKFSGASATPERKELSTQESWHHFGNMQVAM